MSKPSSAARNVCLIAGMALLFNIAYFQRPLYESNQHTKFLHGLASAGYGYLNNDWLAHTIDPLPVFSFLVHITYRFTHGYVFYFYYMILAGIFVYCILAISSQVFRFKNSRLKYLIFFAVLLALHSTVLKVYTSKTFDFDISEAFLGEGVGQQYLLGSYFQPCVFGVFLLVSILVFLKGKPYLAVLSAIVGSYFHSAYLISSGLLAATYVIVVLFKDRNWKKSLLLGLVALCAVMPMVFYYYRYLGPTSEETSKRALDILVNWRIPHHSDPSKWSEGNTIIKVVLITVAILLTRKTKIFHILLIPFAVAVVTTAIHFFLKIDFIGLLAPWRVSVWLVPLSTSIILARLISSSVDKISSRHTKIFTRSVVIVCLVIVLVPICYGLRNVIADFDLYVNYNQNPMMNYVSRSKTPRDTYLIPIDLFEFRLNTGAPVLATRKSHPYKDVEVLEWYERIRMAEEFYKKSDRNKCDVVKTLSARYGVTHVVLPSGSPEETLPCLQQLYRDPEYGVYLIRGL